MSFIIIMLSLLAFLYLQTLLQSSEAAVIPRSTITINSSTKCRTERKLHLLYDNYKLDVCARCYKYMPSSAFHYKLEYRRFHLHDKRTNSTLIPDPFNTSQALMDTFVNEARSSLWKSCCISAFECCHQMLTDPLIGNESTYCPRTWDGWQCWPDTPAGMTATQPCQDHIYFESTPPSCTKYAYKTCLPNGTWYLKDNYKEWTNYTKCGRREDHRRYLHFHVATYIISIISLLPALIIFMAYKQLQVPRITMHKNLFLSLLLNAVADVLFKEIIIENELQRSNGNAGILSENGPGCKILLILTKYFRMTNYMWMFCEGFYLHKLISAAFAEQTNLIVFYVIGWGLPVIPVGIYAILRAVLENEQCWALPVERYEWIMNVPNLLSLVVNLYFLCSIIAVLVTKVRATHANEPNQYRYASYSKAVRATLVLVPLFGLHFCLVIYRPQTGKCGLLQAYTYLNYAMDGLQGLMVAVIFCYLNGEVIYLIRRTYKKYQEHHQLWGSSSTVLRRMSATQDSTINESQHNYTFHWPRKGNHKISKHAKKRHSHDGVLLGNRRGSMNHGVLEAKKRASHDGILMDKRGSNEKILSSEKSSSEGLLLDKSHSSEEILEREKFSSNGVSLSCSDEENLDNKKNGTIQNKKVSWKESVLIVNERNSTCNDRKYMKSSSVEILL